MTGRRSRARALAATALAIGCASVPVRLSASGRAVTFSAADGTTLAGMYFEAAERPAPGVVLVHMLGRTHADWSPLAERLQAVGVTVLAVDLRGHGGSGGDARAFSAMASDLRSALSWLQSRSDVRPAALGLAGASLGANLALIAAAQNPSVRALAMLSPSLDYRGVRIDVSLLRKYGGRPAWLAASAEDPYAVRTVRELASDTTGPRDQRLISAPAHGTNMLAADAALAGELVDWLRQTLIF
jgi:alpha-beta hydrolase superfamily lysophospholipase